MMHLSLLTIMIMRFKLDLRMAFVKFGKMMNHLKLKPCIALTPVCNRVTV